MWLGQVLGAGMSSSRGGRAQLFLSGKGGWIDKYIPSALTTAPNEYDTKSILCILVSYEGLVLGLAAASPGGGHATFESYYP